MTPIVIIVVALAVSYGLTWLLVRLAPRLGLVDVPNERSSHVEIRPRGGGIAIVIAGVGGFLALSLAGVGDATALLGLAGAGLAVAAVPEGLRFRHPTRTGDVVALIDLVR